MYESADTYQPQTEAKKKPGIGCILGLTFLSFLTVCSGKVAVDLVAKQNSSIQIGDYKAFVDYYYDYYTGPNIGAWNIGVNSTRVCGPNTTQYDYWILRRYNGGPVDGEVEFETGPIKCPSHLATSTVQPTSTPMQLNVSP
jgi:hypothetical protein